MLCVWVAWNRLPLDRLMVEVEEHPNPAVVESQRLVAVMVVVIVMGNT